MCADVDGPRSARAGVAVGAGGGEVPAAAPATPRAAASCHDSPAVGAPRPLWAGGGGPPVLGDGSTLGVAPGKLVCGEGSPPGVRPGTLPSGEGPGSGVARRTSA